MRLSKFLDKTYSFQLPGKILFGVGTSDKVGSEVKALGGKEAMLVTDQNLTKMGIAGKIEEALVTEGLDVNVFSDVEAEPRLEVAEKVAEAVRRKRYNIVVGIGGGSVLDMAKVASIAATNPGAMRCYIGLDLVGKPGLPKVLIPTTAGTGSEVTDVAVMTLAEDETKTAIFSPYMLADVAIIDPSLTHTLPPRLTASTGLDALSHALEAMMSINANPVTDTLALQAIALIFTYLPKAYRSGDTESRYGMSLGSLMAGMSFGNAGVCLGHAVAYTFAVSYHVPHGVSCGVALPYVFRFNASSISDKLPPIAEAMHLHVEDLKNEELSVRITDAILRLMDEVQAPKRLRELEVPREAVSRLADRLLGIRRLIQRNPKPLSKEDALKLIGEMW